MTIISTLPTISSLLSSPFPQWQPATWEDYLAICDDPTLEQIKLFFHQGYLLIDIGNEGINHSKSNNLFTMVFFIWFARQPGIIFDSLGGCLMEKPKTAAASPDLVLYIGENSPRWRERERRYLNLNKWRVPDLVGEVGDTTIATDLDEKKQLYAALKVPEYWVIDIKGERVLAFRLQDDGKYQQCEYSVVLERLPMALLGETLKQLNQGTNGSAAQWFAQQIANIKEPN